MVNFWTWARLIMIQYNLVVDVKIVILFNFFWSCVFAFNTRRFGEANRICCKPSFSCSSFLNKVFWCFWIMENLNYQTIYSIFYLCTPVIRAHLALSCRYISGRIIPGHPRDSYCIWTLHWFLLTIKLKVRSPLPSRDLSLLWWMEWNEQCRCRL